MLFISVGHKQINMANLTPDNERKYTLVDSSVAGRWAIGEIKSDLIHRPDLTGETLYLSNFTNWKDIPRVFHFWERFENQIKFICFVAHAKGIGNLALKCGFVPLCEQHNETFPDANGVRFIGGYDAIQNLKIKIQKILNRYDNETLVSPVLSPAVPCRLSCDKPGIQTVASGNDNDKCKRGTTGICEFASCNR
jgi:hypothetical protein